MHKVSLKIYGIAPAIFALCAGCQTPVKMEPIDVSSYYSECPGRCSASLSGTAFGKTKGGTVKPAAGTAIYLDRVTPYSVELFAKLKQAGTTSYQNSQDTVEGLNQDFLKCRKQTTGGIVGNFTFRDLEDGDYFVSSYIRWFTGNEWTGSWHIKRVRVRKGESIKELTLH